MIAPRSRLDAGTWGTMGVGPGYAIAAATVHPERNVVAVEGDSAFGFSGMECETICRWAQLWGAGRRGVPCMLLTHAFAVMFNTLLLHSLAVLLDAGPCRTFLCSLVVDSPLLLLPAAAALSRLYCCRYNLPVCIIVLNNGGIYGGDRREQRLRELATAGKPRQPSLPFQLCRAAVSVLLCLWVGSQCAWGRLPTADAPLPYPCIPTLSCLQAWRRRATLRTPPPRPLCPRRSTTC